MTLGSCNSNDGNSINSGQIEKEGLDTIAKIKNTLTLPKSFEFINTKKENSGEFENRMDLYTVKKEFNTDSMKVFCQIKKDSIQNGTFYYIVIFDKKSNARFPKSPFSAQYGIEYNVMRHIKAIYEFNFQNKYSKLTVYEKNMYDSSPTEIDID